MISHRLAYTGILLAAAAAFAGVPAAPIARTPAPAPATAPASAPAATAPASAEETHWREVLKALGSPEFAERQAAQRELDGITWKQRDLLERLSKGDLDEEARARVLNRMAAIDEDAAINPPPLSLELKNAPIDEVATALSKASGAKITAWPRGGFGGGGGTLFSISAKEMPFWKVFEDMARQAPLNIQAYQGFQLMQQEPALRTAVISGSLAVFPMSITRSTTINLQQPGGGARQRQPEQMMFQCTVGLDPRVRSIRYTQPEFIEIRDDAGNVLYKRPPQNAPNFWDTNGEGMHLWQTNTTLTIPANPGKTIASARGEFRCVVPLRQLAVVISDMDKKLKQPIDVGGESVTIDAFTAREGSINFSFSRKMTAPVNAPHPRAVPDNPAVLVSILDGNGQRIWSNMIQGGVGGGIGGSYTGPFKVEFSVATKTREVTFPFELKDLPLP